MSHPRVLCVSFDDTVSKMRSAGLSEAGYEVISAVSIPAAMAAKPPFDLVIIGHRFGLNDKELLINKAHEWKAKVLLVCGDSNNPELHPDKRVYGLDGIAGIVNKACELVPVHAKSA